LKNFAKTFRFLPHVRELSVKASCGLDERLGKNLPALHEAQGPQGKQLCPNILSLRSNFGFFDFKVDRNVLG
jgi:hypothetical protein